MIKRYSLDWDNLIASNDIKGEWCRYTDIAALEAQLQQAQERVKELEEKWLKFICGEAEHQEKVCIAECHDQKHGYCYDMQRCNQLEAENAGLRADNATMTKFLENLKNYFDNPQKYSGTWPEFYSTSIKHYVSKPHPGDSLLQELEALRAVRSAAEEYLEADGSITAQKLFDALVAVKGE